MVVSSHLILIYSSLHQYLKIISFKNISLCKLKVLTQCYLSLFALVVFYEEKKQGHTYIYILLQVAELLSRAESLEIFCLSV